MKTLLSVVLIWFGLFVVQLVSVRIFYWNYFATLFLPVESALPARVACHLAAGTDRRRARARPVGAVHGLSVSARARGAG